MKSELVIFDKLFFDDNYNDNVELSFNANRVTDNFR